EETGCYGDDGPADARRHLPGLRAGDNHRRRRRRELHRPVRGRFAVPGGRRPAGEHGRCQRGGRRRQLRGGRDRPEPEHHPEPVQRRRRRVLLRRL
ncbi:MAG: hypothetical protein AVDCRST_MAG02-3850, partial [uncultured Rubrobacteraceae bacterium]